jgi:hypothetical protein
MNRKKDWKESKNEERSKLIATVELSGGGCLGEIIRMLEHQVLFGGCLDRTLRKRKESR